LNNKRANDNLLLGTYAMGRSPGDSIWLVFPVPPPNLVEEASINAEDIRLPSRSIASHTPSRSVDP
jgi:hypothetical protein